MRATSTGPGPRYQALLQLLRTADTLWNASRVFFVRWNLSPSQFNVLNLLYDQPTGCSQIELGRLLVMHRSNVTGLVDRLEARELVCRRENSADRRAFKVMLTSTGRKLIRQIQPQYYKAAAEVWGDLPLKRANQLVAELGVVSANAERIARDLFSKAS